MSPHLCAFQRHLWSLKIKGTKDAKEKTDEATGKREVGVYVWRKQNKGGGWSWWVQMPPFCSALIPLECVPRHVIVILWEIWKTVNLSMVLGDHNSEFSSFIQRFALFSRRTLHSLNSGVNVRR